MKGLMKRTASIIAAFALSVSAVMPVGAFGGTTDALTPTEGSDAALYWATKAGSGWSSAPGVPLAVGEELVFPMGKQLRALNKNTGEFLEKTGEMVGNPGFGLVSPVYAEGMIIVPLSNGIIQAFDAETFESLWVYHNELGGQANSEIRYSDGYVYTGFWKSETAEAEFVCVPVADTDPDSPDEEQRAAWTYTRAGGFYWAGAYCEGDYVIVGTDDGLNEGNYSEGSSFISFDKNASIADGEAVIASEADTIGDIRSSVSYDDVSGYYFAVTKGGYLYRFKVDGEGRINSLEYLDMDGMSTSTPVAANGRIYIGVCGEGQFSEHSGHHIAVIDADKFETAYKLYTNGYPQSSALVSTRDGENYVYFTANYTPGKIYAFHDNRSMTEPEKTTAEEYTDFRGNSYIREGCAPTLFTPVGSHAQYCISSLIADEDGTLYFKNDSGNIMAVGSKVVSLKAEGKSLYREGDVFDKGSVKVTAVLANGIEKDVTVYADISFPEDPLETGEDEIIVSYDGMLYGDTEEEIGHEYGAIYTAIDYNVLAAEDYDAIEAVKAAIDAIGEVTLESGADIKNARELYDALGDGLRSYVSNYSVLEAAEKRYAELTDNSDTPEQPEKPDTPEEPESSEKPDDPENSETPEENKNSDTPKDPDTENGSSDKSDTSANSPNNTNSKNTDPASDNPNTGDVYGAAFGAVLLMAAGILVVKRKENDEKA